jgi:hypothetical protein
MVINKSPDELNAMTPRTNAAVLNVLQTGPYYRVNADFARQLEKELFDANKKIEFLELVVDSYSQGKQP